MTITLTKEQIETIIACLRNRAVVIGGATRNDRVEQERLYRLAAQLDQQQTNQNKETEATENDPEDYRVAITPAEAISMLPDGDSIHTFRQAAFGGTLLGADWDRTDILDALRKYSAELTGEIATDMGHGLAFADPTGYVFVQTKQRTPINKDETQ